MFVADSYYGGGAGLSYIRFEWRIDEESSAIFCLLTISGFPFYT